jgi:hypothetical protein
MSQQYLIDKIGYAFKDVNCFGGSTIADCIIADGYGDQDAINEAKGKEENRDWHSIPDQWIEKYDSVFCFANDIGARFLLPAYMIWTIKNASTAKTCTVDFTIYYLDRIGADKAFAELLSNDQKAAIRDFLSFMKNQLMTHCDTTAVESALSKWKCV